MTASSHPITLHTRRRVLAAMAVTAAGLARGVPALAAQTPAPSGASVTPFLDAGAVHDVAVSFDRSAYDAMVETYADTGDKAWIEARVSIDGAVYETAGMRLKGNSSLGGLRGPDGLPPGEEARDGRGDAHEDGGDASADVPEQLPWLVRLDKYVDGQSHDGLTELVVRSNRSATSLNEAVALDLLDLAGLASQRAAAARFTVNGSDPALRLAIEHPNDAWMAARFSPDGLLYKAEAGGDWRYRGDDPAAYDDIFDLEAGGTGDDAADMRPLFGFLAFINDSDDAVFAAALPDHLDIEQLATYLAMMDLIDNADDIDGPGNNAYLYVDAGSDRFTVVPWDMNLAFGGGGVIIRDGEPGGEAPDGLPPPPEGGEGRIVIGGTPVVEHAVDSTGPGARMPAPTPNVLVERWNAVDAFTGMVEEARGRLRADLFESGTAADTLARWVDVLETQAGDMVDADSIAAESDAIAEHFT